MNEKDIATKIPPKEYPAKKVRTNPRRDLFGVLIGKFGKQDKVATVAAFTPEQRARYDGVIDGLVDEVDSTLSQETRRWLKDRLPHMRVNGMDYIILYALHGDNPERYRRLVRAADLLEQSAMARISEIYG